MRGRKQRQQEKEQSTLVFFLKALLGEKVIIELRNESQILGTVDNVDDSMNIFMVDVTITKPQFESESCSILYVNGKNIRYIDIPPGIDVAQTLEAYSNRVSKSREKYSRSIRRSRKEIEAMKPKRMVEKENEKEKEKEKEKTDEP